MRFGGSRPPTVVPQRFVAIRLSPGKENIRVKEYTNPATFRFAR